MQHSHDHDKDIADHPVAPHAHEHAHTDLENSREELSPMAQIIGVAILEFGTFLINFLEQSPNTDEF
jgi:hypothetical protein